MEIAAQVNKRPARGNAHWIASICKADTVTISPITNTHQRHQGAGIVCANFNKPDWVSQGLARFTNTSGGSQILKKYRFNMKNPKEPKRRANGEKPRGIVTSRSIKCTNRWTFDKPVRNPCVTTIIPLDQLNAFASSEISATEFSVQSPAVTAFERIEEPKFCTQKSDKSQYELECSDKLAKFVKGTREVSTPAGRIDVLSNECLYELKLVQNWKHALGQLLVYGFYYPNHQLVLVLLGNQVQEYLPLVTQHSQRLGIEVQVF